MPHVTFMCLTQLFNSGYLGFAFVGGEVFLLIFSSREHHIGIHWMCLQEETKAEPCELGDPVSQQPLVPGLQIVLLHALNIQFCLHAGSVKGQKVIL